MCVMELVWAMLCISMLSCILCYLEEIKKELRKIREILFINQLAALDKEVADEEEMDG